jgi:hypothetical protein
VNYFDIEGHFLALPRDKVNLQTNVSGICTKMVRKPFETGPSLDASWVQSSKAFVGLEEETNSFLPTLAVSETNMVMYVFSFLLNIFNRVLLSLLRVFLH